MPPARSFRLLQGAERERDGAIDYFDDKSLGLGGEFLEAYEAALALAMEYPHAGSPAHYRGVNREVHKYKIGKFYSDIVVTLVAGELIVVAISSHRRKPGYWVRRLKKL